MIFEYISSPDGNQIVKLQGEMDAAGCTLIRNDIENISLTDESPNITLDMRHVSFLDSSGIGMIVFLYKRLKALGRTLDVYGVQGQPLELMELLRINKVINVTKGSPSNQIDVNNNA